MLRSLIAAVALAGAATAAMAAPTASLDTSFEEYTGTGPIGHDNLNTDGVYWFYEGSGVFEGQQVDSWFVFYDPKAYSTVTGTIDFGADIVALTGARDDLIATQGFAKPGVTYDYGNIATGLEPYDIAHTTFEGSTLSLYWHAVNPGDHLRVFTTAVPEPETYALMLAGLVAVGAIARRRKAA